MSTLALVIAVAKVVGLTVLSPTLLIRGAGRSLRMVGTPYV